MWVRKSVCCQSMHTCSRSNIPPRMFYLTEPGEQVGLGERPATLEHLLKLDWAHLQMIPSPGMLHRDDSMSLASFGEVTLFPI